MFTRAVFALPRFNITMKKPETIAPT